MKSKIFTIVLLFCIPFIVGSCSNNEPTEFVAKLTTVSELNTSAGFAWLEPEISIYQVDTTTIKAIKTSWESNKRDFTLFVNPSCSCVGTKKLFPHLVRVLREAGIPESYLKIYSMRSATDKLPEDVKTKGLTVTYLPTIYIRNNDVTVKVITENPVNSTVEQEILLSLQ